MRRWKKIALWTLAALAALLVLTTIAGIFIVRSDRFHQYVQRRIVEEAQRATGGRVDLGGFAFDWHNLTAQVRGFVLHGKESAAEPPLLQIDSATLSLRIISVLEKKIDLASMRIERTHRFAVGPRHQFGSKHRREQRCAWVIVGDRLTDRAKFAR